MFHIVIICAQTKLEGDLQQLHSNDDIGVHVVADNRWLANAHDNINIGSARLLACIFTQRVTVVCRSGSRISTTNVPI